jgi:formylglycine-generating enzyme required for sulfatase activity
MTTATRTARHGAVLVPGGTFRMGSDRFYPEAAPVRTAVVRDLWVDEHPVTNAQFRRFVTTTGHVTVAERPPAAGDFLGADPGDLVFPGRWFAGPPPDRCRWTTGRAGGTGYPEADCLRYRSAARQGQEVRSSTGAWASSASATCPSRAEPAT